MDPIVIARAPGHICFGCADSTSPVSTGDFDQVLISAAVNHHAYTIVTPSRDKGIHITCAEHNVFTGRLPDDDPMWGRELALPRAIARFFGIRERLSVFLCTQAPLGSGLGLAGSLAASMIKALAFVCGLDLDARDVAELAVRVTAEALGLGPGAGHQDAAAYGGLSLIHRVRNHVRVEPLYLPPEFRQSLEKQLMLFESGCSCCGLGGARLQGRDAEMHGSTANSISHVLREVSSNIRAALEQGNLAALGDSLHCLWLEQHRVAVGSEDRLAVECYQVARANGALGGQRIGTAGRGLLVLLCPEVHHQPVTDALTVLGLRRWPLALEEQGVEVMEALPWAKLASVSPMIQTLHRDRNLLRAL